jgi:phosphohistidine phosphatase
VDLILWRHAEAHEREGDQNDLERGLTAKGERQAKRMAEWLNRHLSASTRVLVSPALRAQQTAHAMSRRFRTVTTIGPQADPDALLIAARWPHASESVLLVGHQPALGHVAAKALAGVETSWSIKKSAVWWLRRRDRDSQGETLLLAVLSPDLL